MTTYSTNKTKKILLEYMVPNAYRTLIGEEQGDKIHSKKDWVEWRLYCLGEIIEKERKKSYDKGHIDGINQVTKLRKVFGIK
jgi:hypothetical protein